MATIVERAVNRQRKAMAYLYDANKQKAYYIASNLLGDEQLAAEAVIQVFKSVWSNIPLSGDTSETGFGNIVTQKTVDYCKKKVSARNPKAFRLPANKEFVHASANPADINGDDADFVLSHFTELQRFLFVLHNAGGYSKTQLSRTFQFDLKTINQALESEETNSNRILQASQNGKCSSYAELVKLFQEKQTHVIVPERVDSAVASVIDQLAAPGEKKKKKCIFTVSFIVIVLCLCAATAFLVNTLIESSSSQNNTASLDTSLTYYADITIQDYGTITIKLEEETAPITAANFVALAESGFYDGLTFHRIIEGFMMQGGDPEGNGTGGSGQTIVGEFTQNGYNNPLSHTRGAVSMARANDPDSASSQFFIVHEDSTSSLDGKYAVFGYVTEGMDIVDTICASAEPTDNNGTIPAAAQPVITSITIRTE